MNHVEIKKPQGRLVIYTKDVQRITGKSEQSARRLIHKIRLHFNKDKEQLITIHEFCAFVGMDFEKISL